MRPELVVMETSGHGFQVYERLGSGELLPVSDEYLFKVGALREMRRLKKLRDFEYHAAIKPFSQFERVG